MKPIVDVIIPCYNYADKVERAIESVMRQTVTNLHCYIVDDGSTDNSREVILKKIRGDDRFEYVYQDNAGVANARNNGVFRGVGKYVCCLDADDAIAPNFLEVCIKALEEDRSIAIAYTGLWYIKPDGQEGLSPWPGKFDYDAQLEGKNQIPTCNVARRVVWERLGGQRQRYAPHGAGEEDAEMWLRAGAYGFAAKKVTDEGLFIYSWMSGRVSGARDHKITDYRSWHPWTADKLHPILSLATPKKFSHPVRQYDKPLISVVIPVGEGHEQILINALDSLEAQTFRNWEAVVCWDSPKQIPNWIERAYPYIRLVHNEKQKSGAGYARNRGAEAARGQYLVFLDADDELAPRALERMLAVERLDRETKVIVYTDYVGKAIVSGEYADSIKDRLISYDPRTSVALMHGRALPYDYERAVRSADEETFRSRGDLYLWCLVTTLIPKEFHFEIGGFDEKMPSWEDWDYYLRMAKAGKCFVHLPEELVLYLYYTGERREIGRQEFRPLLQYIFEKHRRIPIMPCNCGNRRSKELEQLNAAYQQAARSSSQVLSAVGDDTMSDEQFILIRYEHPNLGQHRVIGPATGIDYGYRGRGDIFLVHTRDISANPSVFVIAQSATPEERVAPQPQATPPPTPLGQVEPKSARRRKSK